MEAPVGMGGSRFTLTVYKSDAQPINIGMKLSDYEVKEINGQRICPICSGIYSRLGIAPHFHRTHNPNSKRNACSIPAWNKGKTKASDKRVALNGKNIGAALKGNARSPLTASHKLAISVARKKFLDENPDKVPYLLNHSSSKSWPEKLFEDLLISNNINGWVYNFPMKRYRYDFAFPDLKIDVELDGATHQLDKVKKIDIERDAYAVANGWKVLRINAKRMYDLEQRSEILKEVLQILGQ